MSQNQIHQCLKEQILEVKIQMDEGAHKKHFCCGVLLVFLMDSFSWTRIEDLPLGGQVCVEGTKSALKLCPYCLLQDKKSICFQWMVETELFHLYSIPAL